MQPDTGAVNEAHEELWEAIPDVVLHPIRVPIVEALRWTGEPLSPIGLVDVLDGFISTSEAVHHLRYLRTLGVVEPISIPKDQRPLKRGIVEAPYRLTGHDDES